MKKIKVICLSLALVMVCSLAGVGLTYADNQSDLAALNKQIKQMQGKLTQGKKEVNTLTTQIQNLESKISATQSEINSIQNDIEATQARIAQAKEELELIEADLFKQNEDLNARLRAMYKNGKVGFLDVLLGSSSISDFMTNLDRVQMIYDSDKEILEGLEEEKQLIADQKAYLEEMEASLETKKASQASKMNELAEDKSEAAAQKSEVVADNQELASQIDAMQAEADNLVAEIKRLQSSGDYSGGAMTWPAPGVTRITSSFGYRIHPILKVNKMHTGIDIGCGSNTTIVAAADGKVIKTGWNSGYGNMIMIDHGGGIVTLYAHLNSILVSTGSTVTRGSKIALSGSTGMSTGPHLHFEVRENGQYVNPLKWVSAR